MAGSGRAARQSFLGEASEQIHTASEVAIVGVCGGGSHIAQQTAHVGVGRFLLLDDDHTDDPNLNRMVGSEPKHAEDKTPKVEVIRDLILRINPKAIVRAVGGKWQDHHLLLRDCTAVFGCVDSFLAREELERYCRRFLLPYIDVGMIVTSVGDHYAISGQVVTSLPGQPCMRCIGFLTDKILADEISRYGAAGSRPQVIWPNGVLSSTAVGLFIQLLTPWHRGELPLYLEYNGNTSTLTPSRLAEGARSRPCPHFSGLQDIGDTFWAGFPENVSRGCAPWTVPKRLLNRAIAWVSGSTNRDQAAIVLR
ncbi:MAG: hypothetical protein A3F74_27685 [Betaproteobacteria bacterium RIFCSPLOWO2_12_FULL_62_58]|nr:MAG: hypothetical protein A3F74_27685 [Betaproteobacteria bacterium RIFCSPLOWO2_12_FULL_62_58]